MTELLINADAARIPLPDKSIQCCVTSPLAHSAFCGIIPLFTTGVGRFASTYLLGKGPSFLRTKRRYRARPVVNRKDGGLLALGGGAMKRDKLGRFVKGQHYSPDTEFKPGQHWRKRKPWWNREWLFNEYRVCGRSAAEIAHQFDCTENNIFYWLHKHDIPTRNLSEARAMKHWGASGKANGMYGVTGADHPHWKGGVTPERQDLYRSSEWQQATKAVRRRDDCQCQRCGQHEFNEGHEAFHVHHIVAFADSEGLRCEPSNLVLLCPDCHHWVHSNDNESREFMKGGD